MHVIKNTSTEFVTCGKIKIMTSNERNNMASLNDVKPVKQLTFTCSSCPRTEKAKQNRNYYSWKIFGPMLTGNSIIVMVSCDPKNPINFSSHTQASVPPASIFCNSNFCIL